MIDTDKYEGHTGPWKLNKPVENGDYTIQDEMGTYRGTFYSRFRVEDARLMADAPLLLEEVKRLQHAMIYVSMKIFWNENGIPYEYTQLMEYCRQHCGEPDDMSGKLGQMISEFEDEFPYQEELE
tara:strand:+ start:211 stop:585 length:375 start_codon:yes stop_codon:yes gene_type:complete